MSARAPIKGDDSLRASFSKADSDPNFGYLSISIDLDDNKFVVDKYASTEDQSSEDLFKQILSECVEKEHKYFIIRDPTKDTVVKQTNDNDASKVSSNLYILIHFAPDLSPVKQRMMYASSRPSLKAFLGHSSFSEDYHCSTKAEMSLKRIVDARTLHHKIDFRSDAEIEKEQASLDSVATAAKSSVMSKLPVQIDETASSSIEAYKNDEIKCALLNLTANNKSIEGKACGNAVKLNEIRALLDDTEPKYILFWYTKSRKENVEEEKEQMGEKRIFGYYCPDKADARLRFTYSTCKANVIDYCTSNGLEFYSKVEFTTLNEFNAEFMDYHIFPLKEKKEQFAVPKAPKSKNKGKKSKRKKIDVDAL